MFATAGGPSCAGSPLTWNLLFARQPEPDLEFTEEELEQTSNIRSSSPMKPPKNKKSGGSPLLWLLLLVLIGGGAYLAMDPDMAMELMGPILGETSEQEPLPPPIARKPVPSPAPIPAAPPTSPQPAAPSNEPPQMAAQVPIPAPPPTPEHAATLAAPESSPPVPSAPANQALPGPNTPTTTAPASPMPPPAADIPDPRFGEGQRVTLLPSPGAPREKVALMANAEGGTPGPAVPPGTNFTILDGDLQDRGWVYYVRSDYGTKGWLDESQLRAKR